MARVNKGWQFLPAIPRWHVLVFRNVITSSVAPIALDAATAMAALLPEPTWPNKRMHMPTFTPPH